MKTQVEDLGPKLGEGVDLGVQELRLDLEEGEDLGVEEPRPEIGEEKKLEDRFCFGSYLCSWEHATRDGHHHRISWRQREGRGSGIRGITRKEKVGGSGGRSQRWLDGSVFFIWQCTPCFRFALCIFPYLKFF